MSARLPTFDAPEPALSYLADPRFGALLEELRREPVQAAQLVEPYRGLLVHHEHMTAVLQAHHGGALQLEVLQECLDDNIYSRLIQLTVRDSAQVVETGIARLNLELMDDAVRGAILTRNRPLGDVLIRHEVLRWIQPLWFLRFSGRSGLLQPFGPGSPEAFGRIGIIHCHGQPAIELLEIVANA